MAVEFSRRSHSHTELAEEEELAMGTIRARRRVKAVADVHEHISVECGQKPRGSGARVEKMGMELVHSGLPKQLGGSS